MLKRFKTVIYVVMLTRGLTLGSEPAMHNYIEALQNDSNGPQMFAGDRCPGYFLASSPVSASLTFRPDLIPEFHH